MEVKKKVIKTIKSKKKLDTVQSDVATPKTAYVFAVLSYLNNQFKVHVGDKVVFPYIETIKEKEKIVFDQVLMTNDAVGSPYVKSFAIIAECLKQKIKEKKIIVFKYKSKKNYRVKTGHRQSGTLLKILKFENDYKKPKDS